MRSLANRWTSYFTARTHSRHLSLLFRNLRRFSLPHEPASQVQGPDQEQQTGKKRCHIRPDRNPNSRYELPQSALVDHVIAHGLGRPAPKTRTFRRLAYGEGGSTQRPIPKTLGSPRGSRRRSCTSRLRGSDQQLADRPGRLPGADESDAPATLDLNGKVAVRARAGQEGPATELILSRSSYTGQPIRLQTNREFLARAIRLGFVEVEVVDADTPLACRDDRRVLAWQPLSKDSAIGPSDDATRIESDSRPASTPPPVGSPRARIEVTGRIPPEKPAERLVDQV